MPTERAPYTPMPDYAAEQAVEQSALDYTHAVLEEVRELVGRVEGLTDRLCGSVPTKTLDKAGGLAGPGALLPNLRDHAQAIRSRIGDGFDALARIERAL